MKGEATLKRSLSLPVITLYGLGTTVGAGIYVLIGQVAGRAGLFAPLSFLAAAALAGLTAFSFAELSARYPKSAGEALYIREGLRSSSLSLGAGLAVALAGVVSAAAIMIGAAGYAAELLGLPRLPLMAALIVALGGVAAWGITQSALLASAVTLLELAGLLLVVWTGVGPLVEWSPQLVEGSLMPDGSALVGVFAGAMLAFYAFLGFEDMVNVAEEVKDVTKILPLAIVLTLVITTVVYLAVSLVAISAVPSEQLAASEAPLVTIYQANGGRWPQLLTAIGALATMNGALIQMIMSSRILYGLSKQKALPPLFGRINRATRTPLLATGIVVVVILALASFFPIDLLAEATSVMALAVFALVNLALVAIKRRAGPKPDGISVPILVPLCGFLACTGFLLVEVIRIAAALF